MTKADKEKLEIICEYLKAGFQKLNCGRIGQGIEDVEKAEVLLDAFLAMDDKPGSQDIWR